MRKIFCSILILSFLNGCQNAEPATYYLPKNFKGVFAIVYSQSQGSDTIINGRHQFYIPENGILLIKTKFSAGWRDDIFLRTSNKGYDTLKMYMPNKDTTGKEFDETYYKNYTNDSNEVAINNRQIVNPTFNKFDTSGNKIGSCSFQYELITIGKSSTLEDSAGKVFIAPLDEYLQDKFCGEKQ